MFEFRFKRSSKNFMFICVEFQCENIFNKKNTEHKVRIYIIYRKIERERLEN